MTRDGTAAAPAGGDGGISGRSRSSVAVPRGPRNGCAADHDVALVLDAVLVGLLALDDPAARDVDERVLFSVEDCAWEPAVIRGLVLSDATDTVMGLSDARPRGREGDV